MLSGSDIILFAVLGIGLCQQTYKTMQSKHTYYHTSKSLFFSKCLYKGCCFKGL